MTDVQLSPSYTFDTIRNAAHPYFECEFTIARKDVEYENACLRRVESKDDGVDKIVLHGLIGCSISVWQTPGVVILDTAFKPQWFVANSANGRCGMNIVRVPLCAPSTGLLDIKKRPSDLQAAKRSVFGLSKSTVVLFLDDLFFRSYGIHIMPELLGIMAEYLDLGNEVFDVDYPKP